MALIDHDAGRFAVEIECWTCAARIGNGEESAGAVVEEAYHRPNEADFDDAVDGEEGQEDR